MATRALKLLICVATFHVHQFAIDAQAVSSEIDGQPDHIDGNFLKSIAGIYTDQSGDPEPEKRARASLDGIEVYEEEIQSKIKSSSDFLLQKEMAFREALALRGRLGQKAVPGEPCDEFITGGDFYIHSPILPQ
ncbi:hypothetical protein SK128_000892 [Halocaridina rubra]|uniref:Uncharacterized protein n=1 Tax=Halocaridina rubra TaxID=373956 RepID=A0AAN8WXR0_HALRR